MLYSLNFAIAFAQKNIGLVISIDHACVAFKHKKTDLSLETSSEINFEFIKFANHLSLTKTNREYLMFGNLPFITIFNYFLLPN